MPSPLCLAPKDGSDHVASLSSRYCFSIPAIVSNHLFSEHVPCARCPLCFRRSATCSSEKLKITKQDLYLYGRKPGLAPQILTFVGPQPGPSPSDSCQILRPNPGLAPDYFAPSASDGKPFEKRHPNVFYWGKVSFALFLICFSGFFSLSLMLPCFPPVSWGHFNSTYSFWIFFKSLFRVVPFYPWYEPHPHAKKNTSVSNACV